MRLITNEKEWFDNAMKVKDAMTRMPFTVAPEVSIFDARKVMQDFKVRHLPVLDRGELVGIVSERDIQIAEAFHNANYQTVRYAMKAKPYSVGPDTPLCQVLSHMIEKKLGSSVVLSPRGIVIGIFTATDALHMLRSIVLLGSREKEDVDFHQASPTLDAAAA